MSYPLIASNKLDGIRCIFINGEIRTRSGKQIQNKALQKKYEWLKTKSKTLGVIFDGELYSHKREFNEISGIVRTIEGEAPDDLMFYCFDCIDQEIPNMPYSQRRGLIITYLDKEQDIGNLKAFNCKDSDDVEWAMEYCLNEGYEGLILINPESTYKQGRITVPSGDGYKLKPYRTFDAKITGVVQATVVDPEAEKTINELGHSVTSKKHEDRIPIDKAAAFEVEWQGTTVKPTLAMTDEEKEEVWANREDYIGRWVEFKGMLVGAKDKPRHPVVVRMRTDLDE